MRCGQGDWPEPFALVMIEAMACGTPVLAFRCGSVPEVIRDGVSGFIVKNADEAAAVAAFLMFRRAAARCLAVAIQPLRLRVRAAFFATRERSAELRFLAAA